MEKPLDLLEEEPFDRMWIVNIGNIHFKTADEKQTSDENEGTILDVYERYSL
jgi:hypothetical protein